MTAAFFCYERNFSGRWVPVVYYDREPRPSKHGPEMSSVWQVEDDCLSADGTPIFGKLMRKRPAPGMTGNGS